LERNKKRRAESQEHPALYEVKLQDNNVEAPVSISANHKFIQGDSEKKENIIKTLNNIKENYKTFQLGEFIEGSKAAYDMIISAFEKDALDSIKNFVSNSIFNEFNTLRQSYSEKKYKYTNAITNIESAIITDAAISEKAAQITVEIKSQNVIALEDENGNILHGDPKQIKMVTDIWTFEREFASSSPAWVLISK